LTSATVLELDIMNAYPPGKTVYQQYYTFIMVSMIKKNPIQQARKCP